MGLIDKSAVIAEIKRIMAEEMSFFKDCIEDELENTSSPAVYTRMEMILSFLDTLEVKEVDIEKEISKFIDTNFEKATTGHKISLRRTARYFYELGLRTKGETL